MRRFSILSLMGLVLAVAVSFAAYSVVRMPGGRGAWSWRCSDCWATRSWPPCTVEGEVAAWLGFLVMAGGYFLAVRALPQPEPSWLPTSQALQIVQDRLFGGNSLTVAFVASGASAGSASGGDYIVYTTTSGNTVANVTLPAPSAALTNPVTVNGTAGTTPAFYAPLWPLGPNRAAFNSVGQSLFALLAGWVGALLSRWMWARRVAQEPS